MTDAVHQKLCFPLIVYSNHSVTLRLLTYSRTYLIYVCDYDYCYYVTMYYYNLEISFIVLIVQKRNNKKNGRIRVRLLLSVRFVLSAGGQSCLGIIKGCARPPALRFIATRPADIGAYASRLSHHYHDLGSIQARCNC